MLQALNFETVLRINNWNYFRQLYNSVSRLCLTSDIPLCHWFDSILLFHCVTLDFVIPRILTWIVYWTSLLAPAFV